MLLNFVVWGADPEIFQINRFSLSNFHLFIGLFIFLLQPVIYFILKKDKKSILNFEAVFMYAVIAAVISILSSAFIQVGTEIFGFGPVSVRWYGLLFASGFLIGQQILFYIFRKDHKPEKDVEVITIYVVLATVIGARLGHVFFYDWDLYKNDPIEILQIWKGGLASHGATISILFALWLYSRSRKDQSFFWIVDRIVITVALGGALIRMGNLANSEIYGKPTDVPWAFIYALPEGLEGSMKESANEIYQSQVSPANTQNVLSVLTDVSAVEADGKDFKYNNAIYKPISYRFKYDKKFIDSANIVRVTKEIITRVSNSESFADNIYINETNLSSSILTEKKSISITFNAFGKTRHPSQIYEALFCIFLLALTFWLWRYKRHLIPEGFISGVFIILLFTFRFIVEYMKKEQVDRERGMVLNIGQQLSIPAVLFGIGIMVWGFYKMNKPGNEIAKEIISDKIYNFVFIEIVKATGVSNDRLLLLYFKLKNNIFGTCKLLIRVLTSLIFENIGLEELTGIGKWLIKFADNRKIWIFEGEIGAGKTTFIKFICRAIGVENNIQSPTFSLVNEYRNADNTAIYHFDFYRINHQDEAMDIGFEEYLSSGNYCFIEWPSKVPDLLPKNAFKIVISKNTDADKRDISAYLL